MPTLICTEYIRWRKGWKSRRERDSKILKKFNPKSSNWIISWRKERRNAVRKEDASNNNIGWWGRGKKGPGCKDEDWKIVKRKTCCGITSILKLHSAQKMEDIIRLMRPGVQPNKTDFTFLSRLFARWMVIFFFHSFTTVVILYEIPTLPSLIKLKLFQLFRAKNMALPLFTIKKEKGERVLRTYICMCLYSARRQVESIKRQEV